MTALGDIKVEGLSVSYERKRVLTNIYMELEGGHVYGVIGPNGAGKSTLFKAILGLIEVNAGQITFGQDRQIGQLSGGQQQRVFIARALCQEAEVFFLDEPFVGVDIMTEQRIISILKRLANEGKTLLVVHHDLATVTDYFSKVILLNQRLIAYGDTASTFTDDNVKRCYGAQLSILHKTGLIG